MIWFYSFINVSNFTALVLHFYIYSYLQTLDNKSRIDIIVDREKCRQIKYRKEMKTEYDKNGKNNSTQHDALSKQPFFTFLKIAWKFF